MKVKKLIKKLERYDQEKDVEVFAAGDVYPVLDVNIWTADDGKEVVEIACGWNPVYNEGQI